MKTAQDNFLANKESLESLWQNQQIETEGLKISLEQLSDPRVRFLFSCFALVLKLCGFPELAERCVLSSAHKHGADGKFKEVSGFAQLESNYWDEKSQELRTEISWLQIDENSDVSSLGIRVAISPMPLFAGICRREVQYYCESDSYCYVPWGQGTHESGNSPHKKVRREWHESDDYGVTR